jgi:tetratricopeptide (TPR) repeat protein
MVIMKRLLIIPFLLISMASFSQEMGNLNFEYSLIEASRLKALGNINEAIRLYRQCLEIKPNSDVVLYELGSIYAAYGENTEAEPLLAQAWSIDKENYWYVLAYTQILGINKKDQESSKILKAYLKNNDELKLKFMLAENYFSMGKYKKSMKLLMQIESEYGTAELLALRKAEIFKKTGEFDKGKEELLRLINLLPESPDYIILLAEYLEEGGQHEEALKWFRTAYSMDSTNVYAITNLADYFNRDGFTPEGFYFLEKAFNLDNIKVENKINTIIFLFNNEKEFLRNKVLIAKLVEILIGKYPNDPGVLSACYDYYNKSGNNTQAYAIIRRLIDTRKDNIQIWRQLLYNASIEGAYDDMIKYANEALTLFPMERDLNLFVGIAWYQKNENELAYNILKTAYSDDINPVLIPQYLLFMAESGYKAGFKDEAFKFYEDLLKIEPDNLPVLNNYSYFLALEGIKLQKAEELSRKTIESEPNSATYLDTYAWILFKLGKYDDALKIIERALSANSKDADILFHYAEILRANGLNNRAVLAYENALNAGYNAEEIIPALNKLKSDGE